MAVADLLDDRAGIAADDLGDQGHQGAEDRILHRGKGHVGQSGEKGHKGRAGNAGGEIIGRDHHIQQGHIIARNRQQHEQKVGERGQQRAQQQDFNDAETDRQDAAQKAAGKGHEQAKGLDHRADLLLAVAEILEKNIGDHPEHDVGDPVKTDQEQEQQPGSQGIAPEEIKHRRDIALHDDGSLDKAQPDQTRGHGQGRTSGGPEPQQFHTKGGQRAVAQQAGQLPFPMGGQIRAQVKGQDKSADGEQKQRKKAEIDPVAMFVLPGLADLRFTDRERGDHADQHGQGHAEVGDLPGRVVIIAERRAERAGQEQGPRAGDQHADAIAGDVGGGHHGL